jgi:RNA polymerase sigma-70 factor (ECF subfamily)
VTAAVRVFPGRAEQAAELRRWVRAQARVACGDATDDAELAADELFTNAVLHSRSGLPGGTVTVAVAAGRDGMTIHVHDVGTGEELTGEPGYAVGQTDGLSEGGRGLQIVVAVCARWGIRPAASCPAQALDAPAVVAGGRCTWCRVASRQQNQREEHRDQALPHSSDGAEFTAELYARYGGPLMRLALRLADGDWHRAEDLVQEVMVRAWRHRDRIPAGRERGWLAVTIRHLAVDRYRQWRVRQACEEQYAGAVRPADDLAERMAEQVTVSAAVAALPPGRRAVVAEVYLAGRTIEETAARLGIPPGTVKSRLFGARAVLRTVLGEQASPAGVGLSGRAVR